MRITKISSKTAKERFEQHFGKGTAAKLQEYVDTHPDAEYVTVSDNTKAGVTGWPNWVVWCRAPGGGSGGTTPKGQEKKGK